MRLCECLYSLCSIVRVNVMLCCDRLNTLLELKIENERLQQHINTVRDHSQQLSATHAAQHLSSYPGDDLPAQLTANLGLPARPTISADSSRPHYSMPHGYESVGGFSALSALEDDGDSEPRRKKVSHLHDLTRVACFSDTSLPS
jgi:hypothetical protein